MDKKSIDGVSESGAFQLNTLGSDRTSGDPVGRYRTAGDKVVHFAT